MSNYERKFGRGTYGRYGQGQQVPEPSKVQWAGWSDFGGGLDLRDARHELPENSSPNALDIEISSKDELHRAPGFFSVEQWAGRNPTQLFVQSTLDYTAELLMVDPPYLGVRSAALTTWTDEDLPESSEPYGHVNYAGTMIFSDGTEMVYRRSAGASTIDQLLEAPPARTYANFAARVFAGNVFVDGVREPLGIVWSAASSFEDDWHGEGGGYEILVGNQNHADKIVSMRPLGFDMLAIICRRSVWVGLRTGVVDRPADFQMRAEGPGALTDKAVSVLPEGVMYLSDSGVYLFDGNAPRLVSDQINDELLPLDLSRMNDYATYYHPGFKKFYLFTPTATWIFDLGRGRWLKRSLIAQGASIFGIQLAGQAQTDTYDLYVLTRSAAGIASLAREDELATDNIDIPLDPTWEFLMTQGPFMNQLGTFQQFLVEHKGSGTVQFAVTDVNAHYQPVVERTLISSGTELPVITQIPFQYSGMALGARIRFLSGAARISKVQLGFVQRGPRIETGTFAPREYYEDFKG